MRIDKTGLLDSISVWNNFVGRKIKLVACGGTAMTLLEVKVSTKDIDLMVPDEKEYQALLSNLIKSGYKQTTGSGWAKDGVFVYDIYCGNRIHTTELIESPLLQGNSFLVKEFTKIELRVLNYYDLITSKLMRGTGVDHDDCTMLAEAKRKEIDFEKLESRFKETVSYDISEERVLQNFKDFKNILIKKRIAYVK